MTNQSPLTNKQKIGLLKGLIKNLKKRKREKAELQEQSEINSEDILNDLI